MVMVVLFICRGQLKTRKVRFYCWNQKFLEPWFETVLNSFKNNNAKEKGGAIYYDLFSPNGLTENMFQ